MATRADLGSLGGICEYSQKAAGGRGTPEELALLALPVIHELPSEERWLSVRIGTAGAVLVLLSF